MGGFDSLQIALSSLYAQRRAIDVTGQNLANVNTDGYSRQRVDMASNSGPVTPAMYARWVGTGMGVTADSIQRLRDQFLDLRSYQEHASGARLTQAQATLATVEGTIGEPSDTGLATQLADFWAGWDDVANRPDDPAARTQLVQRASTLAAGFQQFDDAMATYQASAVDQLDVTVREINATATSIADLNARINAAVATGLSPNDLMDQRDLLISKLADTAGVTIRPGDDGTMNVFVGGTALVMGARSESLAVVADPSNPGLMSVRWTKDNSVAALSGTGAGLLDGINDVIPRYRAGVAGVAAQVMTATNSVHTTGFDLNGNPGQPFFVASGSGIAVNPAIAADPRLVAAAATPGTLDGSVASTLATTTAPDAAYRRLVVGLGVEAQSANRRVDIQSAIVKQVDAARDSASGVNLDEEMTNLVMYQHAYDAAAKYMSVLDSTLDTLINHTAA